MKRGWLTSVTGVNANSEGSGILHGHSSRPPCDGRSAFLVSFPVQLHLSSLFSHRHTCSTQNRGKSLPPCLLPAPWILRRKLNPQQTLGSALLTQAALLTKDSISRTQWTVKFHYLYMWALLALPMWISVTQMAVWTQTAADRIIHAHAPGWGQHTAPVCWLTQGRTAQDSGSKWTAMLLQELSSIILDYKTMLGDRFSHLISANASTWSKSEKNAK